MLIQCTKKLLDELNMQPMVVQEELPLFSWHANIITLNRRKTIVLVNDSNRYIIVLHALKAKDFKNIDEIIINSIRETLQAECIKGEIIEQFLTYSPGIIYAKTKDRSLVARMNKGCDCVFFYGDLLNTDSINQSAINLRASCYMVGDGKGNYICPNEMIYGDLEIFSKQSIFRCAAVELKITLGLENHTIWRKITVPYHITFKELHDIMQIVFDWRDYHLHEFYIFDGDQPIVNLVCSADAFEYPNDVPMILENDIKISEYISKYSRIQYNYDFGDNWQHYIEVGKIIEDYTQNFPVCLSGEGNAPPEDVGGEGGYDEFLEAIADPSHPEHKGMIDWAKMQWYRNFDIEIVNKRLKTSLKK